MEDLIGNFYVIWRLNNDEALWERIQNPTRAENLRRKAKEALSTVEMTLSRVVLDYLFCASLGELRHRKRSNKGYELYVDKGGYTFMFPRSAAFTRAKTYEIAKKIAPTRANWEIMLKAFNVFRWNKSYGGKAWGRIIKHMLSYEPTTLWLDRAIDLVHNTSAVWDKPIDIKPFCWSNRVVSVLDWKRNYDVLKNTEQVISLYSQVAQVYEALLYKDIPAGCTIPMPNYVSGFGGGRLILIKEKEEMPSEQEEDKKCERVCVGEKLPQEADSSV